MKQFAIVAGPLDSAFARKLVDKYLEELRQAQSDVALKEAQPAAINNPASTAVQPDK